MLTVRLAIAVLKKLASTLPATDKLPTDANRFVLVSLQNLYIFFYYGYLPVDWNASRPFPSSCSSVPYRNALMDKCISPPKRWIKMASGPVPIESAVVAELVEPTSFYCYEHQGNCGPAYQTAAPGSSPFHQPMTRQGQCTRKYSLCLLQTTMGF